MKKFRIWLLTAVILLNSSNFGITGNTKEDVPQGSVSQEDVSLGETPISAHKALQDFRIYLNKQIARRNLIFTPKQIESFIAKSRSLIYEGSQEGQISQANSRKIQKDFKLYLKTTYPENFKIKRSKNEVNYKLARRRIRATTKDFVINKLQIKNPATAKEYWNKVKALVDKKLDKSAYFNDFNELVVDESAIAEIIGKVFNKLESDHQNGNSVNSNNPVNPKRKRKAVAPERISAPIAEKLVRHMIRDKGISAKNNDILTLKIMKEINKNLVRGRVSKELVIKTTKQEIKDFLELRSSVMKKASKRYIDRFIEAMGKIPETDQN